MSVLLRIRCSLAESPARCEWVLFGENGTAVAGEGALGELPHADRAQLVIPAAQTVFTRVRLPSAALRQRRGAVLAFAVEERTIGEPNAAAVSWVGTAGDEDVLAVVDRGGLERWRSALADLGWHAPEIHCETLLLPVVPGEWSLAWDGSEGFVRSGEFEGAALDCGDAGAPPLALRLMLEEAREREAAPAAIALYTD
ncbi:MAG: type II secretion system protein GspL, partial [Burkholderiales bacterium]